jgi:hypothetical protein
MVIQMPPADLFENRFEGRNLPAGTVPEQETLVPSTGSGLQKNCREISQRKVAEKNCLQSLPGKMLEIAAYAATIFSEQCRAR